MPRGKRGAIQGGVYGGNEGVMQGDWMSPLQGAFHFSISIKPYQPASREYEVHLLVVLGRLDRP